MSLTDCILTLFFMGILFTHNISWVICSDGTNENTTDSTAVTSSLNGATPRCQCINNNYIYEDIKGNCSTKSWAFKYGQKWCYVDLPSNCKDIRNSSSNPNNKYSAQACSKKGNKIFDKSLQNMMQKIKKPINLLKLDSCFYSSERS